MCEQTPISYNHGDVVWVKINRCWWPGEVVAFDQLPEDVQEALKKPPFAVVKFFQEDSYQYIKSINHIYSYNCSKKMEFLQKGLNLYRTNSKFMETFPSDVETAETKTGGDKDILKDPRLQPVKKEPLKYYHIFGDKKDTPSKRKPKSTPSTPINRVQSRPSLGNRPDVVVKYLIQGSKRPDTPENIYRCNSCTFTTSRVENIAIHNKSHVDGTYVPPSSKRKYTPKKQVKKTSAKKEKIFSDSSEEDFEPKPKKKASTKKKSRKPKIADVDVEEKPKTDIRTDLLAEWDDDSEDSEVEKSFADTTLDQTMPEASNNQAETENNDAEDFEAIPSTSKASVEEKKEDKSCFDFVEDEDVEIPTTSGTRKIPRVIPEIRKSSENEPKTEIDEFEELLEATSVTKIPEMPQLLKYEQNFHSAKTIKFPDKTEDKKSEEKAPEEMPNKYNDLIKKLQGSIKDAFVPIKEEPINPKKRFVRTFVDETKKSEEKAKKEILEAEFLEHAKSIKQTELPLFPEGEDSGSKVQVSKLKSQLMSKLKDYPPAKKEKKAPELPEIDIGDYSKFKLKRNRNRASTMSIEETPEAATSQEFDVSVTKEPEIVEETAIQSEEKMEVDPPITEAAIEEIIMPRRESSRRISKKAVTVEEALEKLESEEPEISTYNEEPNVASPKKEATLSPDKKDSSFASPKKESTISSPKKESTISSPKKESTISSPKKESTISSPKKESSISSPKKEEPPKRSYRSSRRFMKEDVEEVDSKDVPEPEDTKRSSRSSRRFLKEENAEAIPEVSLEKLFEDSEDLMKSRTSKEIEKVENVLVSDDVVIEEPEESKRSSRSSKRFEDTKTNEVEVPIPIIEQPEESKRANRSSKRLDDIKTKTEEVEMFIEQFEDPKKPTRASKRSNKEEEATIMEVAVEKIAESAEETKKTYRTSKRFAKSEVPESPVEEKLEPVVEHLPEETKKSSRQSKRFTKTEDVEIKEEEKLPVLEIEEPKKASRFSKRHGKDDGGIDEKKDEPEEITPAEEESKKPSRASKRFAKNDSEVDSLKKSEVIETEEIKPEDSLNKKRENRSSRRLHKDVEISVQIDEKIEEIPEPKLEETKPEELPIKEEPKKRGRSPKKSIKDEEIPLQIDEKDMSIEVQEEISKKEDGKKHRSTKKAKEEDVDKRDEKVTEESEDTKKSHRTSRKSKEEEEVKKDEKKVEEEDKKTHRSLRRFDKLEEATAPKEEVKTKAAKKALHKFEEELFKADSVVLTKKDDHKKSKTEDSKKGKAKNEEKASSISTRETRKSAFKEETIVPKAKEEFSKSKEDHSKLSKESLKSKEELSKSTNKSESKDTKKSAKDKKKMIEAETKAAEEHPKSYQRRSSRRVSGRKSESSSEYKEIMAVVQEMEVSESVDNKTDDNVMKEEENSVEQTKTDTEIFPESQQSCEKMDVGGDEKTDVLTVQNEVSSAEILTADVPAQIIEEEVVTQENDILHIENEIVHTENETVVVDSEISIDDNMSVEVDSCAVEIPVTKEEEVASPANNNETIENCESVKPAEIQESANLAETADLVENVPDSASLANENNALLSEEIVFDMQPAEIIPNTLEIEQNTVEEAQQETHKNEPVTDSIIDNATVESASKPADTEDKLDIPLEIESKLEDLEKGPEISVEEEHRLLEPEKVVHEEIVVENTNFSVESEIVSNSDSQSSADSSVAVKTDSEAALDFEAEIDKIDTIKPETAQNEDTIALSTLAEVSELTNKETIVTKIPKEATVVSQNDLGNSEVEMANTQPVMLSNFSMDFSAIKNQEITKKADLEQGDSNSIESQVAKLTDTNINAPLAPQEQSPKTSSSKLLDILTDTSKSKPKMNLFAKGIDAKLTKIGLKSASTKSGSKPIILSEKVIKPSIEGDIEVTKTSHKRLHQDIEDIDSYKIYKPSKKLAVEEKDAKKTPVKSHGKARIIQQTIITPSGAIIQPPNDEFDINSMPIVLSDQILTPESLEKIPIVISEGASTPVKAPEPVVKKTMKIITGKPTVQKPQQTTPNILRTAIQKSSLKPSPKIYTGVGTSKVLKNTSIVTPPGKPSKFVVVPSSSATGTKYSVGKKLATARKLVPPTLQNSLKSTGEPTGNKVMIFTNQSGQQSRVLLTPDQQKKFASGAKIIKGAIKQGIQKNILIDPNSPGVSKIAQTVITSKGQMVGSPGTVLAQKQLKIDPKTKKVQKIYTKVTGAPAQRTIVIKNSQGQAIKKITGSDDALLDQQVAEQIQAINKANERQQLLNKAATPQKTIRPPVKKTFAASKKVVVESTSAAVTSTVVAAANKSSIAKTPVTVAATTATNLSLPALAPLSPTKKLTSTNDSTATEESTPEGQKQAFVIQDSLGNRTTITEGQILALPSETVDGQPQSYMLVTLDESGNLKPLNNETLMTLDPTLGGDVANMMLQVDTQNTADGITLGKADNTSTQAPIVQKEEAVVNTESDNVTTEALPVLPAEIPTDVLSQNADATVQTTAASAAGNQQLFITGDPVATQKLIDSLAEGNADLANILANAEGNILIQADGQQFLINTGAGGADAQMLLMNAGAAAENAEVAVPEGSVFTTGKNQDILAAALADTDVFQPELPKVTSQLSPNSGLYPLSVSGVLETSTMNSPIMSPLETPKGSKKLNENDVISAQVPKNVDLPITITDPNISQTVSQQQVASLMAKELHTTLELPLTITDPTVSSTEMSSPSFAFSLPSLEETVGLSKPYTPSISMPLLSDDTEVIEETIVEKIESEEANGMDMNGINKEAEEAPKEEISQGEPFMGTTSSISTISTTSSICNSLSEPPPDMFDFPMSQTFGKSDPDVPIDSSADNTNESSISNNINEEMELLSSTKTFNNSSELELFEAPKSETPLFSNNEEINSPSTNTDENSCEIPVQPEIVTDLNCSSFDEKVGKRKFSDSDEDSASSKKSKFD